MLLTLESWIRVICTHFWSYRNCGKIAFRPHKSAHRAIFGLEWAEQGWNTTRGIRTDQVGPFFQGKMVKKLAQGLQNGPE